MSDGVRGGGKLEEGGRIERNGLLFDSFQI